jgi:hypothetical protein
MRERSMGTEGREDVDRHGGIELHCERRKRGTEWKG